MAKKWIAPKRTFADPLFDLTDEGLRVVLEERKEKRADMLKELGMLNHAAARWQSISMDGKWKGRVVKNVSMKQAYNNLSGVNLRRAMLEQELYTINRTINRIEERLNQSN